MRKKWVGGWESFFIEVGGGGNGIGGMEEKKYLKKIESFLRLEIVVRVKNLMIEFW